LWKQDSLSIEGDQRSVLDARHYFQRMIKRLNVSYPLVNEEVGPFQTPLGLREKESPSSMSSRITSTDEGVPSDILNGNQFPGCRIQQGIRCKRSRTSGAGFLWKGLSRPPRRSVHPSGTKRQRNFLLANNFDGNQGSA